MKLNVDKAFCISLSEAEDRRELLDDEFRKLGVEVEYFLADRMANPQLGCALSHQAVVHLAKEQGLKNVLIYEDDVRFYDFDVQQIGQINDFLEFSDGWEIFYLGGLLGSMWRTRHKGIARFRGITTHSIIISDKIFDSIINYDFSKKDVGIDTFYKRNFKAYAPYPLMTYQEAETVLKSSIQEYRDQLNGTQKPPETQVLTWQQNKKKESWQYNFRNLYKFFLRK